MGYPIPPSEILNYIKRHADAFKLDPALVYAIARKESDFNPFAIRHEPEVDFRFQVHKHAAINRTTMGTEDQLQKYSYGIMQVMGFVLRELGYEGSFLAMGNPDLGIFYGCKKLRQIYDHRNDTCMEDVICFYNGGKKRADGRYSNQIHYVDKVVEFMKIDNPFTPGK